MSPLLSVEISLNFICLSLRHDGSAVESAPLVTVSVHIGFPLGDIVFNIGLSPFHPVFGTGFDAEIAIPRLGNMVDE